MKKVSLIDYVDMDKVWDSIDDFTYSIILAKEKGVELEAKATFYIGKIHYKLLKNEHIAKNYFVHSL